MLEEAPIAKGYAKLLDNSKEVPKAEQCQITGEIPKWLKGTLLRNGPGMFKIGDTQYNHWFDGLAYIQRYHFENGKMFYSAKYLRSETYERNTTAQRIVLDEFGTAKYPDPCKNIFHRYFSYFFENVLTDNGLVNFLKAGDAIFAVTETPRLVQIDPKTLETGTKVNFEDCVAVNTVTAHQHIDHDGSVLNVGSKFGRSAYYVFTKTDPPSEEDRRDASKVLQSTSVVGRVKLDEPMLPSYFHSFGMSENHIVLFESPLRVNVYTILGARFRGTSTREAFEWHPEKPTSVHVVNRHTGETHPVVLKSSPFFTFHHANGFEKDGHIVVDYCKIKQADGIMNALDLNAMRAEGIKLQSDEERAFLHRMIIPLKMSHLLKPGTDLLRNVPFAGKCRAIVEDDGKSIRLEDERLCSAAFEFPRYNYDLNAKEYHYCYGSHILVDADDLKGIVKADLAKRTHQLWNRDHSQQICAEPVFIPRPGASEEDDGVLVCPILTSKDGDTPFVLVLNARDMSELARCTVEHLLPLGFHAQFYEGF